MAKLNLVLPALFCFLALSYAAETQMNEASTGDMPDSVTTFNPLIELPQSDRETTVVPELGASTDSTEEMSTVTFRSEEHRFDGPRMKRLHHGHRHFKPEEKSFGDEAMPERWVKFHHHGEHEFGDSNGSDAMEIVSENDDVRRPDHHRHHHRFESEGENEGEDHRDHHHRFDRDDDEDREGRNQKFGRDDGSEGRHHRRHHHHHHHRHHDGEDLDEEGGVVMKMRKFLMSRF